MRSLQIDVGTQRELWRQLAQGSGNKVICLAECYFHTVEAPVEVRVVEQLDEFEAFLLRAVTFLQHASVQQVDGLMHVGRHTIRQATIPLVENGLLAEDVGQSLQITAKGTAAIESGLTSRTDCRRTLFHFIHPTNQYIRIHDVRRVTLHDLKRHETPADWHWDATILKQCISSTAEWKREREFPIDVLRLITQEDLDANQQLCNNVDNSGTDDSNRPTELHLLEKYAILDTAQAGQCVMVIGFDGVRPMELHAYLLAQIGSGRRTTPKAMFSTRGSDTIKQILPGLTELQVPERLREAWLAAAAYHGLEGPDRATIHMDEIRIVIGLDDSLTMEWLSFCWQVIKGEHFVCIDLPAMNCLCMLVIEATDQVSKSRLDALGLLHQLVTVYAVQRSFTSTPMLDAALSESGHSGQVDMRDLSSLAWQLGEYRLAYNLAELEDMMDVHA